MNRIRLLLPLLMLAAILVLSSETKPPKLFTAPLLQDNVTPDMLNPGFWISRHPSPDAVIMNPDQIVKFNTSIRNRRGSVANLPNLTGSIAGRTIRNGIENGLKVLRNMRLYDANGVRVPDSYWSPIKANCNLGSIPGSIKIRTALAAVFADQRIVPSDVNFNKKAFDYEFDELQNSGYDIGTPLVIYHTSADGLWAYGSSAVTSGWFRVSELCFVDQVAWKDYQNALDFAVVISDRAEVWQDSLSTRWSGFARMGSRFPLLGEKGDNYIINLPVRDSLGSRLISGYISRRDCQRGYLTYTARNVYLLAFRMLDRPYGWADMHGNTDCSSFIRQLFACFGIVLPRNSAEQEKSGKIAYSFKSGETALKRNDLLIKHGKPAITVLRRPGHVTLYLGSVDGRGYIIHNTWAERMKNDKKSNDIHVIDRVVVSDVFIGDKSTLGPMIRHFSAVSVLKN